MSAAVTVLLIEEMVCQIAVAGSDDPAGSSLLQRATRAVIENAEVDTRDTGRRRIRYTVEQTRELLQHFGRLAAALQVGGDYERSTACAQAAESIRRVLEGPVLT
jgi:hypothetical protein